MGSEHIIQMLIQAMLALAVFSFLEYSIKTMHAPDVVNRRAKLLCAMGLTLTILGIWVVMFHRMAGILMAVSGSIIAVLTMVWLELRGRDVRIEVHDSEEPGDPPTAPVDSSSTSESLSENGHIAGEEIG
jgi:fatty acid desaturase